MPRKVFRASAAALCVAAAPLWASSAQAGLPGSPGYCPGDALMHDWNTGEAIGPCPVGEGFANVPLGNVWVDGNGIVHPAPTPRGEESDGPFPDSYPVEGGDRPNPRPVPVQPRAAPQASPGTADPFGGRP